MIYVLSILTSGAQARAAAFACVQRLALRVFEIRAVARADAPTRTFTALAQRGWRRE